MPHKIKFAEFRILLAASAATLATAANAAALEIPVTLEPRPCGEGDQYTCYGYSPESGGEDFHFDTTVDEPIVDFKLTLSPLPDAESWRLFNMTLFAMESASFSFQYPDSSFSGGAHFIGLSLIDSDENVFALGGRLLSPLCFESQSTWFCSDGNSMAWTKQFGDPYGTLGLNDVDPTLPSIRGPVTFRYTWSVYGDTPTTSILRVRGTAIRFTLAPVPEPGTAVLLGIGLAALATSKRFDA